MALYSKFPVAVYVGEYCDNNYYYDDDVGDNVKDEASIKVPRYTKFPLGNGEPVHVGE